MTTVTITVQRKHKTSRRLGNPCRQQTYIESICRASVKESLKWFEALRLNISEIIGATIRYLMNEKWVKHAASPGELGLPIQAL
jgi:NAD-dependent DNA ligase